MISNAYRIITEPTQQGGAVMNNEKQKDKASIADMVAFLFILPTYLFLITISISTEEEFYQESVYYVKDHRTDLCFITEPNIVGQRRAIANVPCTREVEGLIAIEEGRGK